jgi:V/A-type H+-transporting ATPase subunit F
VKLDKGKSVAAIGKREVIMGFRLIGISTSREADARDVDRVLSGMIAEGKHSMIMVTEDLRSGISSRLLERIETMNDPLVIFVPMPGGTEEESVSKLAKRILGVEIGE